LDIIKEKINYEGEVKQPKLRISSKKQSYLLQFCNKKMTSDFVSIGIKQNKSKTIEIPKINDKFFYHFLRGVIEGDGSIIRDEKRLFVFLNSASKIFLEQIANKINLTYKIREMKSGLYRLVYWNPHSEELCRRIYEDSEGIRLTRKYNKYIGIE
jgi:hypothetical protein